MSHHDDAIDRDDVDALRSLCVDIARAAGEHAHAARRTLGAGRRAAHDTKSSEVDPVTEFDRETEELVVERLRAARPDDSIVGEEGAAHAGSSGLEWHVDPIDGTVNFVYDLPGWCTSIAVLRDGEPLAGAIHAPALGDTYSAAAGGGATVGDEPISVSGASDLATALIATGFSYDVERDRRDQAAQIAGLLPQVRDIRRIGSAALDLAAVASGRVDGYYEEHLNSWDVAAGVLLVREAGGIVTTHAGQRLDVRAPAGVLAAGPQLHATLLDALAGAL